MYFKVVGAGPFIKRLGSTTEVTVQDLNAAGTLTTLRSDKTYLEPLGQEPIELLPEPGGALLNDNGTCLYQATDHLSHAKFRRPDGTTIELEPPAGSLSPFAEGIVALSPQDFYFCKARRPDGKNDFYTTVQGGVGKDYLMAPEGLAPSTEVTPLTATTNDALWANAPGGTAQDPSPFAGLQNAGKLARYDFTSRSWTSTVVPPRADFLPASGFRYVDASSTSVLTFSFGNNFSPAAPPPQVSWFNYFQVLVQSGAPFTIERESTVITGGSSRVVASTVEPVPHTGQPYAVHTVTGLNEAGEVIGTMTDVDGTRPVIFPPSGAPQDLVALLPPGAPAGSWRALKIAGRYVVLEHSNADGASVYLWFRGTQP